MPIDDKKVRDAIRELREKTKKRNFNQSVELIINLRDVDMKRPEERIQELIELPHPIGKEVKVCVFATGDMALRARRSGADMVLGREEIEALLNDKKEQRRIANSVDFFLAEPTLMPLIGRVFGSILGPRGKMPRPVPPTADIGREIDRARRMVLVRTRGQPVLHCRVGTENMTDEELTDNIQTVLRRIEGRLRRGMRNIKSVFLKMTMGPSVRVNI
ncbi:50S ribosomal protein L1 [Candidatus Bathyarchaeota archaeon]|nr:MAG: 50S ribosomal protein L1 [Candidatus Bathyarchaeota archaeon]